MQTHTRDVSFSLPQKQNPSKTPPTSPPHPHPPPPGRSPDQCSAAHLRSCLRPFHALLPSRPSSRQPPLSLPLSISHKCRNLCRTASLSLSLPPPPPTPPKTVHRQHSPSLSSCPLPLVPSLPPSLCCCSFSVFFLLLFEFDKKKYPWRRDETHTHSHTTHPTR